MTNKEWADLINERINLTHEALQQAAMGYGQVHGAVLEQHSFKPPYEEDQECEKCGLIPPTGLFTTCAGPSVKPNPPYAYVGTSADVLRHALTTMPPRATLSDKSCTCPLSGPDGLMARGCTCGGS